MVNIDETRQSLQVTRDRGMQERRGFVLEPFGTEADLELVRHFIRCVREGQLLPPPPPVKTAFAPSKSPSPATNPRVPDSQ